MAGSGARSTSGSVGESRDPRRLAAELLELGRRSGLDRVGICDAKPFEEARAAIEDRKRSGLAAGMQFTFRNPRRSTDISRTLPGARALLVGARSYRRSNPSVACSEGPRARIARYSWVDHYRPLRESLSQVASRLEEEGWRAKVLVDDNALVDRAAAVRAGLGWYGKNSNVLLPGAGSWFVLGSVATDAPIAARPAPRIGDGCGGCHRCMSDCPTGAIVAPGRIDAGRCLAWLLQAPGPFPVEHRGALGDRIYGCDECQERCPVNRRGDRASSPAGAESAAQPTLPVLEILSAADEELEAMVGRWYIPGRELRYVRRNALVVLGNTGDPQDPAVEAALGSALADPDPLLRGHAVWAAGRLGRLDLLRPLGDDGDPFVAEELRRLGA